MEENETNFVEMDEYSDSRGFKPYSSKIDQKNTINSKKKKKSFKEWKKSLKRKFSGPRIFGHKSPIGNKYEYKDLENKVEEDQALRKINIWLSTFSFLGILIMILTNFLNYDFVEMKEYANMHKVGVPNYNNLNYCIYHFVKLVNVGITMICFFFIYRYYYMKTKIEKRIWGYNTLFAAFIYSSLWKKFIIEIIAHLYTPLFPLPFIDMISYFRDPTKCVGQSTSDLLCDEQLQAYYTINSLGDKLGVIMYLRLYLLFRLIRDNSMVYSQRLRIINIYRKKNLPLPHFGWKLTFRVVFSQFTAPTMAIIALIITSWCSLTLWLAERQDNLELGYVLNVPWFTLITMMCIGYGEYFPTSVVGRMVCIAQGLMGTIVVTMLTGFVTLALKPSEKFRETSRFLAKDELKKKHFIASIHIIELYYVYYRKKRMSNRQFLREKRILYKKVRKYKKRLLHLNSTLLKNDKWNKESLFHTLYNKNKKLKREMTNLLRELRLLLKMVDPEADYHKIVDQTLVVNQWKSVSSNLKKRNSVLKPSSTTILKVGTEIASHKGETPMTPESTNTPESTPPNLIEFE